MTSSYKPHLIAEFKTGLFNYLEPWIRPNEAFQPLINAFTQRGVLQRRNGYTVLGRMSYEDEIATGTGAGGVYSGTITSHPIVTGSVVVTVVTSAGLETFTDNGAGVLTGSLVPPDVGTINYTTGAWSITIANARTVAIGVNFYATFTPSLSRPIMGLKTWTNEVDDSEILVALDTRRASYYDILTNTFVPINQISQQIWLGDGSTTAITINTNWAAVSPYTQIFVPFTVTLTDGTTTVTDDGAGAFPPAGNFAAGNTVNYATGAIHLVFTAAPASTVKITMTATIQGDYFTGNNTNFFNSTNWLGYLFLTNNADPITLFNGINKTLSRPAFSTTATDQARFINDILKTLDVDVYKNRFIVQRPTLRDTSIGLEAQGFYWSAIVPSFGGNFGGQASPTNLVNDVAGNGGFLNAPTDDFIESSEFLRDYLVVQFKRSTWTFRFTNNNFDPFRWDKINATKSTNAPYATVPYDERITSAGSTGLIACDGINVQRYDIPIIDQWLDIDQQFFGQCFGLRSDSINQTWMLYPSINTDNNGASDRVLVYNFLENSWAVYDWLFGQPNVSFSCLGLYNTTRDRTWGSFADTIPANTWEEQTVPWNYYLEQQLSPDIIGGDVLGGIWTMDDGIQDGSGNFSSQVTSTQWNPFFGLGQRTDFGYIDFYYEKSPGTNATTPWVELTLTFMVNNDASTAITRTLTLDGTDNQTKNWKRVYVQLNGEFIQMTMQDNASSSWKIYGMILWASPAGRLTPGATI